MTFDEFEALADAEWQRIPEDYRAGVDGLVVERGAKPHPELDDVYTLGECLTETWPSEFGGPDTTRSIVVLYYGSFFRLARLDSDFDWEEELWETLTHELQHHLESLATDDSLGDMDYAADQNYRRWQGDAFDPFFFRSGLPEDGWYRVEDEFFLEVPTPVPGAPLHFTWRDAAYEAEPPADLGDIAFLSIEGVPAAPALSIVVVRRRGFLDLVRSLFRGSAPRVVETDAHARPSH